MEPREYVVFCEGVEIGDASDPYDASSLASKHAGIDRSLRWHKYGIWRALYKGRLYEIKKLRKPRPAREAEEYIPKPRRWG